MSHFTTVKTQMVEKEYLRGALEDLGYAVQEGEVDIRGFGGNRTRVELKIDSGSPGYDIGFRQAGQAYELVADWWGIHTVDRAQLVQQTTQRYAYRATMARLAEQGFSLAREEVDQANRIHLVLRRLG
jgi:hypothetical protein